MLAGLLLAVGLLGRWSALVQIALSLLLAEYAVFLLERGQVDARAPLYAAGFLAVAELAYAALEPPATRRGLARTFVVVVLLAAGAAALGVFLLGAAALSGGTLLEEALGIAAAAAAIALVARLAWTSRV